MVTPEGARNGEVAGWGTRGNALGHDVAFALASSLQALGIEEVFGVLGGGISRLADGLHRAGVRVRHFRHEAGAAFAAHEAGLASGRPAALCVTTGPGLYNALTGVAAARADGGRLLVLSGATSPAQRGRGAVQETSPETMPAELFAPGPLFHWARLLSDAAELPAAMAQIALGFQRAGGYVAHLALPLSLQGAPAPAVRLPICNLHEAGPSPRATGAALEALGKGPFAIWAGYGAREASGALRELVHRTGCSVISTPRAKGIFPERDNHYVGVSGAGAHPSVERFMATCAPERLLVLGTRLGEVSSFWSPRLSPPRGFVHVNLAPEAFCGAFPAAPVVAVQSDVGAFLEGLLARMPAGWGKQAPHDHALRPPLPLAPREDGLVRNAFLFQELQREVVDGSAAVVMAEAGNAFAWANHALRFATGGRYRTSAGFGSMGHFVTGVVGAALGRRGKAVVIAGDGAMLMNNEINTAVAYAANAVWIVMNDARFGLTEDGMTALGLDARENRIPRTDFAAFAAAQGALGLGVRSEPLLAGALREALEAPGPVVLDVWTDTDGAAPLLAQRIGTLRKQGSS